MPLPFFYIESKKKMAEKEKTRNTKGSTVYIIEANRAEETEVSNRLSAKTVSIKDLENPKIEAFNYS